MYRDNENTLSWKSYGIHEIRKIRWKWNRKHLSTWHKIGNLGDRKWNKLITTKFRRSARMIDIFRWYFSMYFTVYQYIIKVNDGPFLNLIEATFLSACITPWNHTLCFIVPCTRMSSYLAQFPNITHIKVNNGFKSDIFNLIKLTFFRAYPSLKPHTFVYSTVLDGLARWHGLPDIRHIKVRYGR